MGQLSKIQMLDFTKICQAILAFKLLYEKAYAY